MSVFHQQMLPVYVVEDKQLLYRTKTKQKEIIFRNKQSRIDLVEIPDVEKFNLMFY